MWLNCIFPQHYSDVIMSTMASQITSLTIVYSSVYSGSDQRKHQSSASLAFVRGIHWGPVNSPAQRSSNVENVSIWWRHHGHHHPLHHTHIHQNWMKEDWVCVYLQVESKLYVMQTNRITTVCKMHQFCALVLHKESKLQNKIWNCCTFIRFIQSRLY